MNNKIRLDQLLVQKGLSSSRERAKANIMAGLVLVNEQKTDKAGTLVAPDVNIRIIGEQIGYVSRGGLKLEKAIKFFNIDLIGKTVADVGASTGGFTDCALKNGAVKVFAIDVGYGQLAWQLRNDKRVVNMERTNIRNVTPADIGERLDFITIDVAFISLEKVFPPLKQLLGDSGFILALIKPQFEAGREKIGKKGVVKDPQTHFEVVRKVLTAATENQFEPLGLTFSPIKGPEGNIEYLLYLKNRISPAETLTDAVVWDVVNSAHSQLADQ